MSCGFEELTLKLLMEESKSREMGGRGEYHHCYCSMVWAGVRSVLVPPLLTAVTAAVLNPLNGELLHCSWPAAPCLRELPPLCGHVGLFV